MDFKGENSRLTAEHRRKAFGHRIVVLDPFKIGFAGSQTFNPLDFIDKDSPTAIDECRDLAEALVIRTGQEKDPHWVDSAEAWISALIALVVQYGEPNDRSLQTVRTLLSSPDKLEMAIKLMCASDAWDGMLARMGNQLTHFKDKELGSTLTTTSRFLSLPRYAGRLRQHQDQQLRSGGFAEGQDDGVPDPSAGTPAGTVAIASDVDRLAAPGGGTGRIAGKEQGAFRSGRSGKSRPHGGAGRRGG